MCLCVGVCVCVRVNVYVGFCACGFESMSEFLNVCWGIQPFLFMRHLLCDEGHWSVNNTDLIRDPEPLF